MYTSHLASLLALFLLPGCMDFFGGVEICGDGIDNSNNGLIDCEDINCVCDEECDNGVDDDEDGDVDCEDEDCFDEPECDTDTDTDSGTGS